MLYYSILIAAIAIPIILTLYGFQSSPHRPSNSHPDTPAHMIFIRSLLIGIITSLIFAMPIATIPGFMPPTEPINYLIWMIPLFTVPIMPIILSRSSYQNKPVVFTGMSVGTILTTLSI